MKDSLAPRCISCNGLENDPYPFATEERKCICCNKVVAPLCTFCANHERPIYWVRVPREIVIINGMRTPIGMTNKFRCINN